VTGTCTLPQMVSQLMLLASELAGWLACLLPASTLLAGLRHLAAIVAQLMLLASELAGWLACCQRAPCRYLACWLAGLLHLAAIVAQLMAGI
jgi:uncharacterized membrane protein